MAQLTQRHLAVRLIKAEQAKGKDMKGNAARIMFTIFAAALPVPASAVTMSGSYYEDTSSTGCNGGGPCSVDFAQFPSSLNGMFVTITEVSCDYYSAQPLTEVILGVTDAAANFRRPHHITVAGNAGNWTFGARMTFKVAGGPPRMPRLLLIVPSGIVNAACTIVGTISSQ